MLKGIPPILTPDLFDILMRMGHGDEIVLADGNFPGETMGQRVIWENGADICDLLGAVLEFMPLDESEPYPAILMKPGGDEPTPPIWEKYTSVLNQKSGIAWEYELLSRFEFYPRAQEAFAVVMTSEKAKYANIILRKGVV